MNDTMNLKADNRPGDHILQDLLNAEQERHNSQPQDKKWLTLFLIFQGLVYLIAVICFSYGNPKELGQPYDSQHLACGVDLGLEDYKFIYYVTPIEKQMWRTVCVKDCPMLEEGENESDESLALDCYPNLVISTCQNRPSVGNPQYGTYYYNSIAYQNMCLPNRISYFNQVIQSSRQPMISQMLSDVNQGAYAILFAIILSIDLNLIILRFLLHHTKKVIWTIAITSIVSLVLSGSVGLTYGIKVAANKDIPNRDLHGNEGIDIMHALHTDINTIYIISLLMYFIAICVLIYIIFRRQRINKLASDIKIVCDCIAGRFEDTIKLILASCLVLLAFCIFWFKMALYLFSIGSPLNEPNVLPFDQFKINPITYILGPIHVFELMVVAMAIITSCVFLIQADVVQIYTEWIMQKSPYDGAKLQVRSLSELVTTFMSLNLGSVILGEIILIATWIPRLFINAYTNIRRIRDPKFEVSGIARRIVMYTEDAYLIAFFKNDPFKESSESSYFFNEQMRARDLKREHLGDLYVRLTYFAISNLCVCVTYGLIMASELQAKLSDPVIVVFVAFLFSYLITMLFASIHGKSIECLITLMYRNLSSNPVVVGNYAPETVRKLTEVQQ